MLSVDWICCLTDHSYEYQKDGKKVDSEEYICTSSSEEPGAPGVWKAVRYQPALCVRWF